MSEVYFGINNSAEASGANNENLTWRLTIIKIMESIFKNCYYNFKMLFYSSTLSSDKSRNSILFIRKDFVIQKVIVSEFNFGRHGRTVRLTNGFNLFVFFFPLLINEIVWTFPFFGVQILLIFYWISSETRVSISRIFHFFLHFGENWFKVICFDFFFWLAGSFSIWQF